MLKNQVIAPQRKDVDGFMASKNGIRAPTIFATLAEAREAVLRDKISIIARSEHPLEREGLSGINDSRVITHADVESGTFKSFRTCTDSQFDLIARIRSKEFGHAADYCRYHELDIDSYLAHLSHSFWEYIPGYNVFVVADPVIENRYRVFTSWEEMEKKQGGDSYDLFEGDENLSGSRTPTCVVEQITAIQQMYEKVREVFGTEVCWVVEMQLTEDGQLYFLQRSDGKIFKPVGWSFNSSEEDPHFTVGVKSGYGEVCGATCSDGIEVDVILERGTRLGWLKKDIPSAILSSHIMCNVIEQEDISTVAAYIETYSQGHGDGIRDPHSAIIPMIRSPIYLHMPKLHESFPSKIAAEIKRVQNDKSPGSQDGFLISYTDPDYMVRVKLHIRSDGNEARINVVAVA